MKKHVALTLLAVTALGVLNAHVDLAQVDGRTFVAAQNRLHDPQGWLSDRWTHLVRDCRPVRALDGVQEGAGALAAIRAFSPPDSASAKLVQLLALDDWQLAEVEFAALSPAVVLLRQGSNGWNIVPSAIWSGSTEPWRPAPLIRRYLAQQAPSAPAALLDCLNPKSALFLPR